MMWFVLQSKLGQNDEGITWYNLFTLKPSQICYNIEGNTSVAKKLVWGTAIIGSLHLQHMVPSWRIIWASD